jgi:DNA polymerase III sliding clamp (beta) subunit (PCNA family)
MYFIIQDKVKITKFATIFQYAKNFTESLTLYFSKDKMHIQAMDKAHVCLLDLHIQSTWFDLYEYDEQVESLFVGVNNELLYKIINTKQEQQQIKIEYHDGEDLLNISFTEKQELTMVEEDKKETNKGKKKGKKKTKKEKETKKGKEKGKKKEAPSKKKTSMFDKYFDMKTMDLDEQLLDIPDNEYSVDLILPTKMFVSLSQELSMFDDSVRVVCNQDNVELVAKGHTGTMKVNMNIDDVLEYAIEENISLDMIYSIQYFQMMCQFHKLSDKVALGFSEETPMMMKYELDETSFVRFYLAPKLDDNDDE